MRNVPQAGAKDRGADDVSPAPERVLAEAERELVRRAQGGDASAYEELVRLHHPRVLSVVGSILRHSEDAEDVAQQVMVKAYFSLKRFDQRSAFGTWLYKIAVNECWDHFRKKKVRRLVYEADLSEEQVRRLEARPAEGEDGPGGRPSADRGIEARQILERLLAELDEADRTMLVMKEVGGFTVEEIGQTLGLNVNTVKVRLFRARGRLTEIYRRRMKGRGKRGRAGEERKGGR